MWSMVRRAGLLLGALALLAFGWWGIAAITGSRPAPPAGATLVMGPMTPAGVYSVAAGAQ